MPTNASIYYEVLALLYQGNEIVAYPFAREFWELRSSGVTYSLSPFGNSFSEETLEHRFCSESSSVSLSALYQNRFKLRHWTAIPKIPVQRDNSKAVRNGIARSSIGTVARYSLYALLKLLWLSGCDVVDATTAVVAATVLIKSILKLATFLSGRISKIPSFWWNCY